MNKVNISFGGLAYVPEDAMSKDGDMQLMINLRNKGGELVQRAAPDVEFEKNESGVNIALASVKIHSNTGRRLGLLQGGRALYDLTSRKLVAWGTTVLYPTAVITNFVISGNVLTLYRERNGSEIPPIYVIWRGDEFVVLGELPSAPKLTIGQTPSVKTVTTDSKYYVTLRGAMDNDAEDLYNLYVKKGFMDEVLSLWYNDGGFIDRAMFRVALRLFDGSYISYSPIYYSEFIGGIFGSSSSFPYGGEYNFTWDAVGDTSSKEKFTASILGYKVELGFEGFDLSLWQDIIVSVDVFTSGSIMMHKAVKKADTREAGSSEYALTKLYEDYEYIGEGEVIQSITTETRFYKMAEYNLTGRRVYVEEDTSPSNLSTKEVLTDYASKHSIGGDLDYFYNGRLHMAGVRQYLHRGYNDLRYWGNYTGNDVFVKKMTVITRLMTDEGVKTVINESVNQTFNGHRLTPFITYPDARAESIDIYILYRLTSESSTVALYRVAHETVKLSRHAYWDMAYNINVGSKMSVEMTYDTTASVTLYYKDAVKNFFGRAGEFTVVYDAAQGAWYYGDVVFHNKSGAGMNGVNIRGTATNGDTITFTLKDDEYSAAGYEGRDFSSWEQVGESGKFYDVTVGLDASGELDYVVNVSEDGTEHREGVMRVAAVDNPFYFPVAQTYDFDARIVGLASNAEAISQGQFGEFPLFVFTKEGVWAMQVDASGKGAYSLKTPFSREVCTGAVTPVSGGVAFLTERGCMLISGGAVADISQVLDGDTMPMEMLGGDLIGKLYDIAGLQALNVIRFRAYLQGAKIAYNYLYNEIIVSNTDEGYSYVYDVNEGKWGMIDVVFNYVTNSYPQLIVYLNDGQSKRIEFKDENEKNNVLFITRPVKFSTLGYKRLRQAALRCRFEGELNFYVLASNDGAGWVGIAGKEFSGSMNRDLVTGMCRSKEYRFMALCACGTMKGCISLAELLVDDGFVNNRLR